MNEENTNVMNEEIMETNTPKPEVTQEEVPSTESNEEIPVENETENNSSEDSPEEEIVEPEVETNETGEKVLFDAEAGIDNTVDPSVESQGEISPEIAQAFMGMMAGLAGKNSDDTNTENTEDAPEAEVVEDSSNTENSGELKPDYAFDKDSEEVQQYKSNVFERGWVDEPFVQNHACPVCGFTEKKTLRLVAYKGIFRRKSKVIGTASICQNCGLFFLHGTNVKDMLYYLSGKGYKVNFEEQRKDGEEIK